MAQFRAGATAEVIDPVPAAADSVRLPSAAGPVEKGGKCL